MFSLATNIPALWLHTLAGLYERHGRHLPPLSAVLFAILLGRTLADLTWSLVPVPESARWQSPPALPASAAHDPDAMDVNTLINAQLFGHYQAVPAETALLNAPTTPLNLALLGLLADDRERFSRALIAVQNGDEKAYAVGDDVTRGVTLQAIFPDRVILSRNGRLETLHLVRDLPEGLSPTASAEPPTLTPDQVPSGAAPLAQIREEVLRDPAKASEYVRVQPANVNGQFRGYRVYPGRERSAFSAAGLRPGDLVTSVNGIQLDDPAKVPQVLGDWMQAGQINLVIERGGQSQTLSINFN
ncbi:MAG: type II secretion system protein GspC [Nevskiales bacterium]|nr:type II secretion system protein GspC [Nevskiales bacterium]